MKARDRIAMCPPWAESFEYDSIGALATFRIGGVTQRFRWCPAGIFIMGSPYYELGRLPDEIQRGVRVEGFWLADTPVTKLFFKEAGREPRSNGANVSEHSPVVSIQSSYAQHFCDKFGFRLPSEAEWEYAARAGTRGPSWNERVAVTELAWVAENTDREMPVARGKPPNPWGLYDMLGNVWEYVTDAYEEKEHYAMTRGGSYRSPGRLARAACRSAFDQSRWPSDVGFRMAWSAS